jgi:hypothetical protein
MTAMRSARHLRLIALAIVGVLLYCGSVGAGCSGWDTSAMARMSCCHGEGHDRTQAAADSCCAAGEQRRSGDLPGAVLSTVCPVPVIVSFPGLAVPFVARPSDRPSWDISLPVGSPPDTHVLLSVFLI